MDYPPLAASRHSPRKRGETSTLAETPNHDSLEPRPLDLCPLKADLTPVRRPGSRFRPVPKGGRERKVRAPWRQGAGEIPAGRGSSPGSGTAPQKSDRRAFVSGKGETVG
ncbi:hypothetical protein GCM10007417_09480 [Glycocaulis alkaliphilus]|nr:hypothetical protein GCM10007417_09480 [Glycocaulis alkaliphilus]